jgi:hypothetical protein
MKVYLEKETSVWINGKEIKVKAGTQEVNDEVGRILIEAGYAKKIEEKTEKKTEKAK